MDISEINKCFKEQGINMTLFVEATPYSYSHVRKVCLRETTSKRVAQLISAAIGKPVKEVFPDKPSYWEKQPTKREKIQNLKNKFADVA